MLTVGGNVVADTLSCSGRRRPANARSTRDWSRRQAVRTSAIVTGRCSCSESVQASAIQPASSASATVHGEGRLPRPR